MKKVFKRADQIFFILMILFVSILMQIFFIPRLPNKYFYDSTGILSIVNGTAYGYFDASYVFTGKFFSIINIFNFTTFSQWAYLLTILLSIITIIYLLRFERITVTDMIFIYLTIALANMYLFRISKELIQLLFWIIMYLYIRKGGRNPYPLLIIYIIEGMVFRVYYYAIGIVTMLIYLLMSKGKKNNIIKIIVYSSIICFLGLVVLKNISPSSYNYLLNLRILINQNRLESYDAITIINDWITNNGSVIVFMINYVINFIRMIFPIELVTKGIKYIPFIIYQLYLIISLIRITAYVIKQKKEKYYIYIAIIFGYMAIANLFEPDFGSLIRHEVTLYVIYLELFIDIKKEWILEYESRKKH